MNVRLYGNLSYLSKCQNVYILLLCQIVGVLGASETIMNEKNKTLSKKHEMPNCVLSSVKKKNKSYKYLYFCRLQTHQSDRIEEPFHKIL